MQNQQPQHNESKMSDVASLYDDMCITSHVRIRDAWLEQDCKEEKDVQTISPPTKHLEDTYGRFLSKEEWEEMDTVRLCVCLSVLVCVCVCARARARGLVFVRDRYETTTHK